MARLLLKAGLTGATIALLASPAAAYIGPGLGLGAIGAILGSIAAVLMVIAGLVWYPAKIMLRKMRAKKTGAAVGESAGSTSLDTPEKT